jgi:putative transposase
VNHEKISRLYREERLTVRKRGCRKRAPRTRATVADNSISGVCIARELDRIASVGGCPCMVVSDNGT